MPQPGDAGQAVRQIEFWYKRYVASFVEESRTAPLITAAGPQGVAARTGPTGQRSPINAQVIARAHELSWRHAVAKARSTCQPRDWDAMTTGDESRAYWDLLAWTAVTYRVPIDNLTDQLSLPGYRKQPR